MSCHNFSKSELRGKNGCHLVCCRFWMQLSKLAPINHRSDKLKLFPSDVGDIDVLAPYEVEKTLHRGH